jgi:hypothetical protein
VYAVGAYGEILRSKGDGKWTEAGLSDTHALLLCVWGSGPNDVYVAGNDGEIFHSAGNGKWTPQNLPEKETVWGIFGVGPKEIYAAADKLYRSSGDGTWVAVDVPGLDGAKSVFADARGTLWIGARDGKLFVRKNGVWSHTQDAHAGSYQALWASGDDLYIGAERFLEWTDPE